MQLSGAPTSSLQVFNEITPPPVHIPYPQCAYHILRVHFPAQEAKEQGEKRVGHLKRALQALRAEKNRLDVIIPVRSYSSRVTLSSGAEREPRLRVT